MQRKNLCKHATNIVKMAKKKGPNLDIFLLISLQIIVTETWFLACKFQLSSREIITKLEQNVPKTVKTCHQNVNRWWQRHRRTGHDHMSSHQSAKKDWFTRVKLPLLCPGCLHKTNPGSSIKSNMKTYSSCFEHLFWVVYIIDTIVTWNTFCWQVD